MGVGERASGFQPGRRPCGVGIVEAFPGERLDGHRVVAARKERYVACERDVHLRGFCRARGVLRGAVLHQQPVGVVFGRHVVQRYPELRGGVVPVAVYAPHVRGAVGGGILQIEGVQVPHWGVVAVPADGRVADRVVCALAGQRGGRRRGCGRGRS
jgi:hypothetical protein